MNIFAIILIVFCKHFVFATAQEPDKLVYNGKTYDLFSNPLESYFDKHPDKRPKSDLVSTTNRKSKSINKSLICNISYSRGYVATFELKNNNLYIADIEIEDTTNKDRIVVKSKSIIDNVFPNKNERRIYWYSGLLVLPEGEIVDYVHLGYESTYKQYTILEIDKGTLTKKAKFKNKDYEEFKTKQFQLFRQTAEYVEVKELLKNLKPDYGEANIDSFLRNSVTDCTLKILTK